MKHLWLTTCVLLLIACSNPTEPEAVEFPCELEMGSMYPDLIFDYTINNGVLHLITRSKSPHRNLTDKSISVEYVRVPVVWQFPRGKKKVLGTGTGYVALKDGTKITSVRPEMDYYHFGEIKVRINPRQTAYVSNIWLKDERPTAELVQRLNKTAIWPPDSHTAINF